MSSVDNRIVSMQFDNDRFERKIADTIKSLDRLQTSLDFANSKRGLNDLSAASKNFNMGEMSNAIDGISNKFLAMATIGITALSNLTNRAVDSAVRIVKAFTFSPTIEGFREYETQLNSVQTILANTASKGTTLDQVNAALQQLNEYSDKTIYNFGQMAKNIGTFTAAGVDLDTSVGAIKGIANLAAVSGSNAEQASSAMYQLSQALATGTLKLIDWNSVVNAGMGGEVFKNALFETGKAMGKLTNVPVGQTFKEWEKANGSFRDSLEKGWVTSDVLTTALSTFTGDLTDAELKAKGFTESQITSIQKMAKTAVGAATEVKTFTQLMGTVKEAVATGWADSFKIIIGNFTEAKELWTGINNSIGNFVNHSAEARNELLQSWKDLGGRTLLINSLKEAFENIGRIIRPITEAFREIFPPMTAQRLLEMTKSFSDFVNYLKIGAETTDKIKRIFSGFFALLEIGWVIIKEIFGVIGEVLGALSPAGSSLIDFGASAGDMAVKLNEALVAGGKIRDFFIRLGDILVAPITLLIELKDRIVEFFSVGIKSDAVTENVERVGSRIEHLSNVWDRLTERLQGVFKVLDRIWQHISTWFSELGSKIANAFRPGDFDAAVDIVNVGLLGGIAILLKRFVQGGLKLDFGGGLLEKISNSFDQLTGTLKTMQADLKANILIKIAGAVGILTASMVLLSLIDSSALTKALVAISVGFGQLIAVMFLMDQLISSAGAAFKLGILSAVFIELAIAMGILSVAIKNLSSLSWEELAKGLVGIGVGLGIMVVGVNLISANTTGMIRAGIAMMAISVALNILALAVKSFAEMSWSEMGKGLVAVGIGLGLITAAMNFMPPSSILSGVGFLAVATGLRILAEALQAFGTMSWSEMGKGLLGVAAGLSVIAVVMSIMPLSLPVTAAGVLILSVALNILALAVKTMGENDLGTLAKGIGAFAAMLLILSTAMIAMTGTAPGAAALLIVSGALLILTKVLKELGELSIAQIVTGLAALAGVFIVIAGAVILFAGTIPILMGLGIAIGLIGSGFALFGVGAMLLAKALEMLSKTGVVGIKALVEASKVFISAIPEIVTALAKSIIGLVSELLVAVPLLVRLIGAILLQLLETIIDLAPEIAKAISVIVIEGLKLIRELFPEILATGLELLVTFLKGVRDNMSLIISAGTDLIIAFVAAIVSNMDRLITAATVLILSFLSEIGNHVGELIQAGFQLLVNILLGISNNIFLVINLVGDIIATFITTLGNNATKLTEAGTTALINFLNGISNNIHRIITAGADLVIKFIQGLASNSLKVVNAAAETLISFINGLAEAIRTHSADLRDAGWNIATAIVDGLTGGLASKVGEVKDGFVNLAKDGLKTLGGPLGFLIKSPSRKTFEIGKKVAEGLALALSKDKTASNSASLLANRMIDSMQDILGRIPNELNNMDNFNPIITPVLDLTKVQMASSDIAKLMKVSAISPNISFDRARLISTTADLEKPTVDASVQQGPSEITFEQNIFSPSALSVNDIYRNTKSQIALAKEELGIS